MLLYTVIICKAIFFWLANKLQYIIYYLDDHCNDEEFDDAHARKLDHQKIASVVLAKKKKVIKDISFLIEEGTLWFGSNIKSGQWA